jgi:hypothetical protein
LKAKNEQLDADLKKKVKTDLKQIKKEDEKIITKI